MASNQRCDRTKVITESFDYKWIIENFQFLEHQPGESFESPHFSFGSSDVSWFLDIYPRGETKDLSDFISLFLGLECENSTNVNINVKFALSIINRNKVVVEYDTIKHTYTKQTGFGYQKFITREKLIKECKSDDSFTIRCEIERAMTTATESSTSPAISSDLQLQYHQWGEDYRRLLKNGDELSDVTIIVKGKEIPAHKFPLAARSSVFAAMFKHKDLEENRTNEIKIEDIDPEVVEAMLEFIYTDDVTDLAGLADRLIAAAHKYDLARLITMCEIALCKCLDTKKAANILILAGLYGSQKFIDHIIDYIADCFRRGITVENYESVEDPELLRKVTFAALKK